MAITALGPTNAGGMQPIVEQGYELLYYPDVMNSELQQSGNAPVFYYMPKTLRMARQGGREDSDFLFNLIRFSGVQSADTTVGVTEGSREVAGGVLTFSVTGAAPDHILKTSQKKIIDRFTASTDYFWGIRTRVEPVFRPVIITSNITSITNLAPLPDGSVPAAEPRRLPSNTPPGASGSTNGHGLEIRSYAVPPLARLPKSVPANRDGSGDSNLSAWYWHVQGQGNGSMDPTGTHAYSALVGAYPASILWAGFHGAYSPINVWMNVKVKFWTPQIKIIIDGHWDRIFEHFSAAVSARYLWFSADIKTEFNKMRTNGTITTKILVDPTIPGGEEVAKNLEKKSDLVFDKFMAAAQKMIFEQPQPQVEAAQASSGGGGFFSPWGVGVGLKYRRDTTQLNLHFEEERQIAFLQDDQISGTMEGMYAEMKADPGAERKYFLSVFLEDWPRRLGRVIRPVVNWPQPENHWVGQPVKFASVQVGYPNTNGEIMWTGRSFTKADPDEVNWNFTMSQKQLSDVTNPPAGWTPDKTYIKRSVHLLEPPDPAENPFVRVQIDKDIITIDPEPNGTLMNDTTIEVRADSAGKLMVGPITLNIELENDKQIVEATFEPTNENGQPTGREPVRFVWKASDQTEPRFWSIFTGDPNFRVFFNYQIRVIVKGTLFSAGMEWTGPVERASVNGPLMIRVPLQNEPGVTTRALPLSALTSRLPVEAGGAPPAARAKAGAPTMGVGETAAYRSAAPLEVSGYTLGSQTREAPPAMASSTHPVRATRDANVTDDESTSNRGRPVTEGLDLDSELRPGRAVVEQSESGASGMATKSPTYFRETAGGEEIHFEEPPAIPESSSRKKYG